MTKKYKEKKFYNVIIKRFADFIFAMVLLIIISPLLLVLGLLIKLDSKGPAFYRGLRTGYKGKTFRIYKFRSMVQDAEMLGGGTTALNDSRITAVGKFIRKTKLDEIPQLLNILKGDMSFIGPRPELPRYTDQYQGEEKIILNVRPGITDISSIKFISLDEIVGGDNADENYEKHVLQQKNLYRIQYVKEQSIFLDLKLFFLTVFKVVQKAFRIITGKGIRYGNNQAA